MDKKILKIAKQYADKVRTVIQPDLIVLFGSRASGKARPDSDIDIAVIVNQIQGDYLNLSAKLFALAPQVDIRIEPILLGRKTNTSGFLEHILKTGKIIYKKPAARTICKE